MLGKIKRSIKRLLHKPEPKPWASYDTLIQFIETHKVDTIDGDFVEIGTFLGGGARKLSKHLSSKSKNKKLIVMDVFDPKFDWTKNLDGDSMSELYVSTLNKYQGKTQKEVFLENTKGCENIVIVEGDTMKANIPTENISFAFIDGNHAPEYVENDFYLIWNKLAPGGVVAFHDYQGDLPQTTEMIDNLKEKHKDEILKTDIAEKEWIFFIQKS